MHRQRSNTTRVSSSDATCARPSGALGDRFSVAHCTARTSRPRRTRPIQSSPAAPPPRTCRNVGLESLPAFESVRDGGGNAGILREAPNGLTHSFTLTSLMTSLFNRTALTHMKSWSVQDAKARFSELLDDCVREGPQLVTKRGIDSAMLVPIDTWNRLQHQASRSLKELLLSDGPRDLPVPTRGRLKRRSPAQDG